MQADVFLHSHSTVQLSVTVSLRVFTDLWLHLDFDTIGISKSVFVLQKNGEDTRKKKTKAKSLTLRDLNRSTKEYFYMSKMGFFFLFFCFVFPFIQIGYTFEISPIEVSRWNSEIITELSQC